MKEKELKMQQKEKVKEETSLDIELANILGVYSEPNRISSRTQHVYRIWKALFKAMTKSTR